MPHHRNELPLDLYNPNRRPLREEDVRRAMGLSAEYLGEGQFYITGGAEAHGVTLLPFFECDCRVFLFPGGLISKEEAAEHNANQTRPRPFICKHLIAALLRIEDEESVRIATSLRESMDAELAAASRQSEEAADLRVKERRARFRPLARATKDVG